MRSELDPKNHRNAFEVPKPFVVDPFDSRIIDEKRTVFFNDVLDFHDVTHTERLAFCDVTPRMMVEDYPGKLIPSDDRITLLKFKGATIAIVAEIRDDFNFVEVLFSHYPERFRRLS